MCRCSRPRTSAVSLAEHSALQRILAYADGQELSQAATRERGSPPPHRPTHPPHTPTHPLPGHKYAGNVVVYGAMHPCDGDVFGGVTAACADAFLDALMGVEVGG